MNSQSRQIELLKEYIKTLIATKIVFPGILPRRWGQGFSKDELQEIYLGLQLVINMAGPRTPKVVIDEYLSVTSPDMNMHWFLCVFWRDVVEILQGEPMLSRREQFVSN